MGDQVTSRNGSLSCAAPSDSLSWQDLQLYAHIYNMHVHGGEGEERNT